ncbi:SGNH/GDSL hydrolase family protein [Couchioplanes caeruleus]|uniref:GDSL family lipase n=2 Tax=Couchioplanes caeruleus TaxID=56438 RepID=A0A1K0GR69_9ACTN|nr:SGNH/GDSL hydrolase family protein [Couchioplanes caeruleus]OJF14902.1 GDSL family lipase [Couchioplanes caeruleus subsp. caeruleus]ROP31090.1 lysophospholipase L1-like esterase [Couchioplanes caeruleus]
MAWKNFVAMGDSFTEGMDDSYPDGTYRGWADLVAARLAVEAGPDFGYANLAVRGKLLDQIIGEQLEPALAMQPSLVSLAAGGNDVLRRKVDPWALVEKLDSVVGRMRATGADVILFRFADVTAVLPGQRIVGPRAAALNDGVGQIAERHGAHLIDLFADKTFHNPLMWSADRLHMSAAGHRRVAGHVLKALGVGVKEEWLLVPPMPAPTPWLLARGADLRWAGQHLAPWIKRRLAGASSGDAVTAKRPELTPVKAIA